MAYSLPWKAAQTAYRRGEIHRMAMNHAAKHMVWMRNLLQDMGLGQYVAEPTVLLGDNKQAGKWGREDIRA